MSVREEDRQKNCPSRGLGIAAAAIGVGVGAALYYFFNKRSENPDGEGSTSNWSCEELQSLEYYNRNEEDDSFTTISEHSTTDTSMCETEISTESIISVNDTSDNETSFSDSLENDTSYTDSLENDTSDNDDTESISSYTDMSTGFADHSDLDSSSATVADLRRRVRAAFVRWNRPFLSSFWGYSHSVGAPFQSNSDNIMDTDVEWDVTTSAADVPTHQRPSLLSIFLEKRRLRLTKEDPMSLIRDQAFREREWTLEECSICFDVMLKNQEVMALPCTHRFHQQCILPWLQEKQTCPNCRKQADCKLYDFLQ